MKNIIIWLSLVFLISAPQNSSAYTAGEVMDKISKPYRTGYLIGLIDMHSYHAILANNRARADCIAEASNKDATIDRILRAFDRWPDKPAVGLVILILNKACGG